MVTKTDLETITLEQWLKRNSILDFINKIEDEKPICTFKMVHWWDSDNDKFAFDIERNLCTCFEIEISFEGLNVIVNQREVGFQDFDGIMSTCQENADDWVVIALHKSEDRMLSKFDALVSTEKLLKWKLPMQRQHVIENANLQDMFSFDRWVKIYGETLTLIELVEQKKRQMF
jgi:hypothetical protein